MESKSALPKANSSQSLKTGGWEIVCWTFWKVYFEGLGWFLEG